MQRANKAPMHHVHCAQRTQHQHALMYVAAFTELVPIMVSLQEDKPKAVMTVSTRSVLAAWSMCCGSRSMAA